MLTKTLPAKIKAIEADEGVVEAIVATYDVDSIGDKIIPGAFKNSLAKRLAKDQPLPFVWSHKSDDPDYHIGVVEEIEERPEGLWVKARLDLDEPKAAKVFRLMKGRRITEFSFAYEEVDVRPVAEKSDDGARMELHELEIFECGPTMIGCNRATSLVGVKHDQGEDGTSGHIADTATKLSDTAAGLKAGRVLSKENEGLVEQIHALAAQLLAAVKGEPADETGEKATPIEPADTPDSQVAAAAPETKSVEPAEGTAASRIPSSDFWLLMELEADAEAY